jgi:hypothetical protein
MMKIIMLEIKKIASSCAIMAFFALCLAFNALLIFSNGADKYADYVASVSVSAGVALGDEFNKKLAALPQSEHRERLAAETAALGNVFAGYSSAEIAEAYIDRLKLSGKIAEGMRGKYADLQNEIDEKAGRGDSLSLYFAGSTYGWHSNLFGSVMPALCMEGILTAVLVALYSLGYENMSRTEQIVYSSKAGRRVILKKYIAAAASSVGGHLLLTAITLSICLAFIDCGDIWGSNVSSGFNAIRDLVLGGFRPFATWHSFTVLSYLLATAAVSVGIVLCLSLAGFAVGVSVRNSYMGFMAIFAASVFCVAFPMALPNNSGVRFAMMLTPIWLALKQPLWFTDGGFDILWRGFEVRGVCLSLAALLALAAAAAILFRKKEIA